MFMKLSGIAFAVLLVLDCSEMETKWMRKFDALGPGHYRINSISCTKDEIYLTGTFRGENEGSKCFTAMYDSEGTLKWHYILQTMETENAQGNAVFAARTRTELLSSRTDIYVLAQTHDNDVHQRVILIKFDSLGNVQWQHTVTTHDGSLTSVLLSDFEGNIYVAGCERDKENKPTIYIGKYDECGKTSWFTKYYNELLDYEELKFDVMQPGYIVAAGTMKTTGELFYMRYGRNGQFIGITQYDNNNAEFNLAGVKIGPEGNVYVTGTAVDPETNSDFLTVAYDKDNKLLWAKQYDGAAHKNDVAGTIAVDDSLNVYVCGSSESTEGVQNLVTVKYDKDGNIAWIATMEEKRPAEPIFMDPPYIQIGKKSEPGYSHIAGAIENDAVIIRCNLNGFYSSYRKYGIGGKVTRPTALSGTCMALECVSEETSEARLVKSGTTTILGIARWD